MLVWAVVAWVEVAWAVLVWAVVEWVEVASALAVLDSKPEEASSAVDNSSLVELQVSEAKGPWEVVAQDSAKADSRAAFSR